MAKLSWDEAVNRRYETGTKKGVIYTQDESGEYKNAEAWNGLTAVTESPSGAEESAIYADDMKYGSMYSAEEFGGTIEAYTYPDMFAKCNGEVELTNGMTITGQQREVFGFSYRTILGNAEKGNQYGYKIHLVYGAMAQPSEKAYATVNDSPEAATFSWEFKTNPVTVDDDHQPTSLVILDSTTITPEKLTAIEKILYGDDTTNARLPLPSEIKTILNG